MGSRPRRGGLGSRGGLGGELYVMAIIIMIIIVSLAVIYSVLNGFSKYVAEEKESLQSLRGTEVSASLNGFNTVGGNYVITMKLSGAAPLSNAEAICKYDIGGVQYMQYCSYVINDGVVYVTVPSTLVNGGGVGNLVVLVPTSAA